MNAQVQLYVGSLSNERPYIIFDNFTWQFIQNERIVRFFECRRRFSEKVDTFWYARDTVMPLVVELKK